jgi:hypothetical protein
MPLWLLHAIAGAALIGVAHDVGATAQRTFVASNGNDAHPCTIALPCRSFSAAVANTSTHGEVVVLDSAGYGSVTITKSVSIVAPAGVYAGISPTSGPGVTVNGTDIVVLLRGLTINGQGGANGIYFQQGRSLTVEHCEIANMGANAILASAGDGLVTVRNTLGRSNGFSGVLVLAEGSDLLRLTIADSTFAENAYGVRAFALGGIVDVTVARSIVTNTFIGLQVEASQGASASIWSDGNTISYSLQAAFSFVNSGGSGYIYTSGNNTVGFSGTVVEGGALTPCCGPL